jgi:hypothetical protein
MRWSRGGAGSVVAFSPSGRVREGYVVDGGWIRPSHRVVLRAPGAVTLSN